MAILDPTLRPCLRRGLQAVQLDHETWILSDRQRLSPEVLGLSLGAVRILQEFDGQKSLLEIQRKCISLGLNVSLAEVHEIAQALDDALFLEGPGFEAYLRGPVRRPSCIGCYPPEPAAIRSLLDSLFEPPAGPGKPVEMPVSPAGAGPLRAALLPHMDYRRGGVTYGWGFAELLRQTRSRLFVIVATSHYSLQRFTLTRQDFLTPLGRVATDQEYVDRIVAEFGDEVFADPYAHYPEHSIELEVLMLQHLLADREPFRIVPLLVGSFQDCIERGIDPAEQPDIRRMVQALQRAEASAGEPVCYLISGDLAHIGPKFRDPDPVSEDQLATSARADQQLLDRLAAADPRGLFSEIAREQDRRRICGFPPSWLTLEVTRPGSGRVLHYQQYVDPDRQESVSFAAAGFYQ